MTEGTRFARSQDVEQVHSLALEVFRPSSTQVWPETLVEIVELLDRRHCNVGMATEIVIEPGCSRLLRSDADEKNPSCQIAKRSGAVDRTHLSPNGGPDTSYAATQ